MNNLEADERFAPGDKEERQPGGWCRSQEKALQQKLRGPLSVSPHSQEDWGFPEPSSLPSA